jgi:uncharacterized protein (DUF1330 family)
MRYSSPATAISEKRERPQVSTYIVFNYRITDKDAYAAYPPQVPATLADSGVEILAIDYDAESVEGDAGHATVILRFPSKEAVRAWYDSDAYAAVKPLRIQTTEGIATIAEGFEPPA